MIALHAFQYDQLRNSKIELKHTKDKIIHDKE